MKFFVVVLHFYQPPTQNLTITQNILDSCYLPLLRMLDKKPNVKITLNLSGSLVEQLATLKATEFFDLIQKLSKDQKVELVHSLSYHSLLPLTPESVWQREILENEAILKKNINAPIGSGFFPPELAVDQESISKLGAKYVFVNDAAVKKVPLVRFQDKFLLVGEQRLIDIFRAYPKQLEAAQILHFIHKNKPNQSLFILPNDSELFGHHYAERGKLLSDLIDSPEITFITAKQAIEQFGSKAPEVKKIHLSSWQSPEKLGLWKKRDLQKKYLAFARLATRLTARSQDKRVLTLLDKGWSSCYFYWLSNWPWWYPEMVGNGAQCLIRSVRSAVEVSNEEKRKAEKAYFSLLNQIWQYHWSENVQDQYQKYDAFRKEQTTKLLGI